MIDDDYDGMCAMKENESVFTRSSRRWAGRDLRAV
jgi:hypothetical protein